MLSWSDLGSSNEVAGLYPIPSHALFSILTHETEADAPGSNVELTARGSTNCLSEWYLLPFCIRRQQNRLVTFSGSTSQPLCNLVKGDPERFIIPLSNGSHHLE